MHVQPIKNSIVGIAPIKVCDVIPPIQTQINGSIPTSVLHFLPQSAKYFFILKNNLI